MVEAVGPDPGWDDGAGQLRDPDPGERRTELEATLRLLDAPRVGPRAFGEVVERWGTATEALADQRGLLKLLGARAVQHIHARECLSSVEASLRACEAQSISWATRTDPQYPSALRELHDPPPVVFFRGDSTLLSRRGVGIVGSRKSTEYGRGVASSLARALAHDGITVISGLALGIDGAAHRGALDANGSTVAVLGSGADQLTPVAHRSLGSRIVERGLVVSEFPPGTPARAAHFPRRNRLIAALSVAVVVVEAADRSGASITAMHALDLGRDVFAVPGPIDAPQSRGANALIRDGAGIVTSVEDFIAEIRHGWVGDLFGSREARRPGDPPAGLDAGGEALWERLQDHPLHVDQLALESGIEVRVALVRLTRLEMRGCVVQEPGLRFRRAS